MRLDISAAGLGHDRAGEAGCFPNLTKALTRWLPAEERSRAQGIMWMSARWGGAITPLLVYACLTVMTWRQAFLFFGLIGVVWAVVFAWWYRDDPRTHPGVNAAEAALLPPPPPPAATTSMCPGERWPRRRRSGASAASMRQ